MHEFSTYDLKKNERPCTTKHASFGVYAPEKFE